MATGSDEYIDINCTICAKRNKVVIADFYCFDCVKHMCSDCLGPHNDYNDYHNVIKGKVEDKDILTEKCGKHHDEFITVFCCQHDVLLCRQCHHQDHRSVLFHK